MANRRFVQASRKRHMTWEGVNVDFSDLVTGTAQFITAITQANIEQFPTPTLVRTRGSLMCVADPSSTPGGFANVTMGIMQVTAAAVTATGVPDPATSIGSDWLWWDVFHIGAAASDVIGEDITVHRKQVDSKAMRKLGNNMVLVLVASLLTCEGAMVANVCGAMRFLLKAP